jgi:acyl carrier protein
MVGMNGAESDVEDLIIEVLADCFPARRHNIEGGSRLVEDLNVDSIGVVEVVMALNEVFGIELPDTGIAMWRTASDIYESVMECSKKEC